MNSITATATILSYETSRALLIADNKSLIEKGPADHILYIGGKEYSPKQILDEIQNETEFGRQYINDFIGNEEASRNRANAKVKKEINFGRIIWWLFSRKRAKCA